MQYSIPAPDCQQDSEVYFPTIGECAAPPVAKKVNRKHLKSAYRDAKFRPWFQALSALEELEASGGISVTCHSPSHPYSPTIHLTNPHASLTPLSPSIAKPSKSFGPTFTPEVLTDKEVNHDARFWRGYSVELPGLRQHTQPAVWRDLSDVAAMGWYHHAIRLSGPSTAFTLNLSPAVEGQARNQPNAAKWLSRRIARRLKEGLGRRVAFWFAFEVTVHHRLHVHGELQVAAGDLDAARKALRLAAGEWENVRQHQAKTREDPSVVWTNYSAKDHWRVRPYTHPRLANISRPIKGDWLFATNPVRALANTIYSNRRLEVIDLMASVKSS